MRHNSNIITALAATAVPVYTGFTYLDTLSIHTALTGTLTVTGLINDVGAAADWVVPAGTVGQLLTNGRLSAQGLKFVLSDGADAGKVVVGWEIIK